MSVFDCLPPSRDSGARDPLDRDASLIRRAFELAARQPYGFTFEDLEHVEAYRMRPATAVTALDCVASLTDGRRFHLAHVAGPQLSESVKVTQMMTTEPLPSGRSRFWIDDVAELNHRLGLPLIPPPHTPVILPLPARQ